jgi:hypothetical protein
MNRAKLFAATVAAALLSVVAVGAPAQAATTVGRLSVGQTITGPASTAYRVTAVQNNNHQASATLVGGTRTLCFTDAKPSATAVTYLISVSKVPVYICTATNPYGWK